MSEVVIGIEFINDISLDEFLVNEKIKRAVCMTVINVGELVKNLTSDFTLKYNFIPWKKIAGFRDITAHKYEALNMGDVYKVVKDDFGDLRKQVSEILSKDKDDNN